MAKEKHHQLLGAFTYLIMDVPLLSLKKLKSRIEKIKREILNI